MSIRTGRAVRIGMVLAGLVCSGCEAGRPPAPAVPGGNAERGAALMADYGCGSCHVIPGVRNARGQAGPPLGGWAGREFIAGALPNNPRNLIRWIMVPQAVEPGTAMPNLGVSEREAHDMAAHLFSLP